MSNINFKDKLRVQSSCWVVLLTVVLLLPTALQARDFVEGTHYSPINNVRQFEGQEVVEYFSFSCPGCFAFEPHIKRLVEENLPINLRRVHMPFGGKNAKQSQKVFVLLELLEASHHSDAVFKRIHVDRRVFETDKDIINFFQALGYDPSRIDEMLRSFSADTMLRKMNKEARDLQITSVPSIIIDGAYMINIRNVYSSDDLVALIKFLRAKDQKS